MKSKKKKIVQKSMRLKDYKSDKISINQIINVVQIRETTYCLEKLLLVSQH